MITTLIIDDEIDARNTLKILLKSNCPNIDIVGEASDVHSARKMIVALKPNVISFRHPNARWDRF